MPGSEPGLDKTGHLWSWRPACLEAQGAAGPCAGSLRSPEQQEGRRRQRQRVAARATSDNPGEGSVMFVESAERRGCRLSHQERPEGPLNSHC